MRMSKLNENRLAEIRHRKCLNELLDFCLYGDCLQEETAREYFYWLLPRVLTQNDAIRDFLISKNLNTNVYKTDFSNYESVNANREILTNLGEERFSEFEVDDKKQKDDGIIIDYFDDGFKFFKSQLKSLLDKMKASAKKLKMSDREMKKLEDYLKPKGNLMKLWL